MKRKSKNTESDIENDHDSDIEDEEEEVEDQDAQKTEDTGKTVTKYDELDESDILLDNDPDLDLKWRSLLFSGVPLSIFGTLLIIFSALTQYYTIAIVHTVMLFVLGFSLIIVSFMKSYVLAFFELVVILILTGFDIVRLYMIIPDVLNCDSHHCDHGKKWMAATNFVCMGGMIASLLTVAIILFHVLDMYKKHEYDDLIQTEKELRLKNNKTSIKE